MFWAIYIIHVFLRDTKNLSIWGNRPRHERYCQQYYYEYQRYPVNITDYIYIISYRKEDVNIMIGIIPAIALVYTGMLLESPEKRTSFINMLNGAGTTIEKSVNEFIKTPSTSAVTEDDANTEELH